MSRAERAWLFHDDVLENLTREAVGSDSISEITGTPDRRCHLFCPNCGTQNDETATTCKKCGFNLKGAAAPKFKGTVLMVNTPGTPGTPGRPMVPGSPGSQPGQPGHPVPGPIAAPRPHLKGTMLGVAPPPMGVQPPAPPAGATPGTVPAPAPPPPAAGAGGPLPGPVPPVSLARPAVNPLGGTLVADMSALRSSAYGPGTPGPAGSPPKLGEAGGSFGQTPGPLPPAGSGWPPPGHAQVDQTQQALGYPAPGAGPLHGAGPLVAVGGPGQVGARGPIGTIRNPVLVLVFGMLCFVYAIVQLWLMASELRAFRQKNDLNPILFFIPILNWIEIWNLPEKVLEAKRMAGIHNPQVVHPVGYFFLWPYFFPADLNEIWQAAGSGRASLG